MRSSTRVAMLVHEYYPKDFRVRREAAALIERGYQVDVLALRQKGEPRAEVCEAVRVHRLPVRRHRGAPRAVYVAEYCAFFLLASVRLLLLHCRRRYRVIAVHTPPDFLVYSAWLPRLLGARVVMDIHDLTPDLYLDRFGGERRGLVFALLCLVERLSTRLARRVITAADSGFAVLSGRGVPPEKLEIVLNCPDQRIFQRPSAEAEAWACRERQGPLQIVYHGTVLGRYGIDILLEAARVAAHEIDLRVSIIGEGDDLPRLKKLATELGLEQRVRFTGYVPLGQIPELLRGADLAVVSNRNRYYTNLILPTKLLEYLSLGIPAIVSDTSTVKRYFSPSAVRFFKADDAEDLARCIVELAGDQGRRVAMIRAGYRLLEHMSWPAEAERYGGVIDGLAA